MPRQTIIPLDSGDAYAFDGFNGDDNLHLVDQLQLLIRGLRDKPILYFYAPQGGGKTYLLQACREFARGLRRSCVYLSPGEAAPPRATPQSLICVDDLQCARARADWQRALLGLYEDVAQCGGMAVAGDAPPAQLNLELADLVSRIGGGGVYRLHPMRDDAKRAALKQSARRRGFDLSDPVLDFIMTHYRRDTRALFALLDKMDALSLAEQRRITLPFVRELIG